MTTVMLIDGNSLAYRAFFALPTDLATASGQVTNAVYGFTSMLLNLVRDHRPDRVVVAFDRPEPTFRHELVGTYKANREAAPDILRQQLGLVRQVVESLGIPQIEAAGVEADDVIGTLARSCEARGTTALVVTGDRDSYQLVRDPLVKVLYNRRGVSDYALYDEAGILERTGVPPERYVEYAALRGDPSDNLPGVPGVGEKTAARLLGTYGSLDGIFEHLDELTPKLRAALVENEAVVRQNAVMMALVTDVPLPLDVDAIPPVSPDADKVSTLFNFLEFGSLAPRLSEAFGDLLAGVEAPTRPVIRPDVSTVDRAGFLAAVTSRSRVGLAAEWEGEPGRSDLVGVAAGLDPGTGAAVWLPGAEVGEGELVPTGIPVAVHDAKPLMRSLLGRGGELGSLDLDTKIAAYLLDPSDPRYDLVDLLSKWAGIDLADQETTPSGQLDLGGEAPACELAAAGRALAVCALVEPLQAALSDRGLAELNSEVEVPLVGVLARMEAVGIGVDVSALAGLAAELSATCDRLRSEIVAAAGEEFNVNSTPQLRRILFDKLGLAPQKKTKTGYSTDAATLERLRGEHPVVDLLLRYREVEKLRSTYGEGLIAEVAPDGRIHATFNQTVARTGRLSSDAPNLHNIPVRSEEGRRFREVFVPAPGWSFLVADYNQIELRCIAHLSDDPGLVEAFRSGEDIHRSTAARVFGVAPDEVTTEQRAKAKMVSYGLAYGMEAYGLGQRLNIPTGEAQGILDAYFEAFPAVHDYMERTVAEARERGYTETLFGRRRLIPELSSSIRSVRQAGERQAMNSGIQGLAADIFKVALVRLDGELTRRHLASRLILQVHDEVIVEVASGEETEGRRLVEGAMTGAFDLKVPLLVNIASGGSWAAAKG